MAERGRPTQVLYLNGINAATGRYLNGPRDIAQFADKMPAPRGPRPTVRISRHMALPAEAVPAPRPARLSLIGADDSHVDARTGWGVLFAADESDDVKRALAPPDRAPQEAGGVELPFARAVRAGLQLGGLARGAGRDSRRPRPHQDPVLRGAGRRPRSHSLRLPVPDGRRVRRRPDQLPDAGRVRGLRGKRGEIRNVALRRAGQVGRLLRHPASQRRRHGGSADHLVQPLAAEPWTFRSRSFLAEEATKPNLLGLLHGEGEKHPPALVFTATHGAGFPFGHALARERNGALVCQEWPGIPPGAGVNTILASLKPAHYCSAPDVADDARLHGLIAFHFACFGAGTPMYDNFAAGPGEEPQRLAEQPFVARLPQRLMSHPKGGALAVIGHVGTAPGRTRSRRRAPGTRSGRSGRRSAACSADRAWVGR